MTKTQSTIALLVILALFGLVGQMDYDDAVDQQAHYCAMVKAGDWPDYQGTYRRECRPPKIAQR